MKCIINCNNIKFNRAIRVTFYKRNLYLIVKFIYRLYYTVN